MQQQLTTYRLSTYNTIRNNLQEYLLRKEAKAAARAQEAEAEAEATCKVTLYCSAVVRGKSTL